MFKRIKIANARRSLNGYCAELGIKFEDVDRHADRFIKMFKDDDREIVIKFVAAIKKYKGI